MNYGVASKYDFDNPQKWVTVPDVPLLDEHVMSDESGRPIATVDRAALQEIADNNNRRVYQTGDPATLILGHTSDDPRAEERPAKGFVVNYRVRPFKRDPQTGQVRYTIAGDYKVRHKNAHLLEEYPRRSVELWWSKKELDPIAMLGGSSPERDLGVVIRNGRLNHVSLGASPRGSAVRNAVPNSREGVIRFSTRGNYTVETYSIDSPLRFNKDCMRYEEGNKIHKVMKEFKEGDLHSGSKHGPKVASRKQAVAIALSEAGKSKYAADEEGQSEDADDEEQYSPEDRERVNGPRRERDRDVERQRERQASDHDELQGRRDRRRPPPFQYSEADMGGEMGPNRYESGDFGGDADSLDDYDGGDEAVPYGDEAVPYGNEDDPGSEDPVVEKVFQSKQMKDLSSKVDQILQLLTASTGNPGGQEPMPGMGGEEGMDEMPPPGMGAEAPPPGAEAMGEEEMPPESEPTEEDTRREHGEQPVQMDGYSTGFAGPGSTYIPDFQRSRMSRNGKHTMNGTRRRTQESPEVLKLKRQLDVQARQLKDVRAKYARADAATIVRDLAGENIRFGRTDEEHQAGMREEAEYIATMLMDETGNGEKDVEAYVNDVIRKRFARSRPNPAAPAQVGVARFARAPEAKKGGGQGEDSSADDDFEDTHLQDFQKISEFAALQSGPRKMSRTDAIKFMRKKYGL